MATRTRTITANISPLPPPSLCHASYVSHPLSRASWPYHHLFYLFSPPVFSNLTGLPHCISRYWIWQRRVCRNIIVRLSSRETAKANMSDDFPIPFSQWARELYGTPFKRNYFQSKFHFQLIHFQLTAVQQLSSILPIKLHFTFTRKFTSFVKLLFLESRLNYRSKLFFNDISENILYIKNLADLEFLYMHISLQSSTYLKFVRVRCMSHRAPIIKRRAGISDFDAVCSARAFWQVTHAFGRMKYSAPMFEDERNVSCRGMRATD